MVSRVPNVIKTLQQVTGSRLLLSTRDSIEGRPIREEIGVVVGNSVKSRAVTYDLISRFRGLLGGELPAYTELLSSASAEATSRLMEEAEMLGAGAVVRVRYQTSATADPASGIYCYVMCYGTAVRCEGDPEPVAPVATDPTANTSATSSVE